MIGKLLAKYFARRSAGAVEWVVGIVHLIGPENSFQATLVKWTIVGYKRQISNKWRYLFPYYGEDVGIVGVCFRQSMDLCIEIAVVIRFGMNQPIHTILDNTIFYKY